MQSIVLQLKIQCSQTYACITTSLTAKKIIVSGQQVVIVHIQHSKYSGCSPLLLCKPLKLWNSSYEPLKSLNDHKTRNKAPRLWPKGIPRPSPQTPWVHESPLKNLRSNINCSKMMVVINKSCLTVIIFNITSIQNICSLVLGCLLNLDKK